VKRKGLDTAGVQSYADERNQQGRIGQKMTNLEEINRKSRRLWTRVFDRELDIDFLTGFDQFFCVYFAR
jgi:hypothetical protein